MRLLSRAALALALIGALAACGGGATPAPAAQKLSVEGTEFAYNPSTLEAKAGERLEITLVNKGTLEHDVSIDALGVKLLVPVGQTGTATTEKPVAAGTYEFFCSVAGHKEAGMVGTLTVK